MDEDWSFMENRLGSRGLGLEFDNHCFPMWAAYWDANSMTPGPPDFDDDWIAMHDQPGPLAISEDWTTK